MMVGARGGITTFRAGLPPRRCCGFGDDRNFDAESGCCCCCCAFAGGCCVALAYARLGDVLSSLRETEADGPVAGGVLLLLSMLAIDAPGGGVPLLLLLLTLLNSGCTLTSGIFSFFFGDVPAVDEMRKNERKPYATDRALLQRIHNF